MGCRHKGFVHHQLGFTKTFVQITQLPFRQRFAHGQFGVAGLGKIFRRPLDLLHLRHAADTNVGVGVNVGAARIKALQWVYGKG